MSASMPVFYPAPTTQDHQNFDSAPLLHARGLTRRLDKTTGRALEQIGHAIEYLLDNHALSATGNAQALDEAVAILSRASRGIFAECPVVLPRKIRLVRWLQQRAGIRERVSSSRQ